MKISEKGFTLIELLVTVVIIAILATISIVVYSTVLKNSRDAKRQNDLRLIQSALEDFRGDQNYLPLSTGSCGNGTFTLNCPLKNPTGAKVYLNNISSDPISSNLQYCYLSLPSGCNNTTTNCSSYEIYAKLENPPSGSPNYTCSSNTYNFKITPP